MNPSDTIVCNGVEYVGSSTIESQVVMHSVTLIAFGGNYTSVKSKFVTSCISLFSMIYDKIILSDSLNIKQVQ